MNVHEVFLAPETRTDRFGDYRYLVIGAWDDQAAKDANRGIERTIGGIVRKAQLFNDFKIRYTTIGERVTRRELVPGVQELLRLDGVWISRRLIVPADNAIGWRRETVARDTAREIQQCIDRYMLRAAAHRYSGDQRGTTLSIQVAASNQDAHEAVDDSGFDSVNNSIFMDSSGFTSTQYKGGYFFSNATIPVGSTINSATLTVDVVATLDNPTTDIYMNDVDSAANFTTSADVQNRVLTAASTAWVATGIGSGLKTSPSFAGAVQEVVDRAGWASGNNLCVIVFGRTTPSNFFQVDSYDFDTANAGKIDIDYTAPSTGQPFHLRDERTIPFGGINQFAR